MTEFLVRGQAVSLSFLYPLSERGFLHASALSKIANFTTNLAALSFFIPTGHVLFMVGAMMAVANIAGSIVGVKLAFKYGSGFIRILFLILVSLLICRIAYQMFLI